MKIDAALPCALAGLLLLACSSQSGDAGAGSGPATARPGEPAAPAAPPVRLSFPEVEGWERGQPTSSMRAAEYTLPPAPGDAKPATLVVYYFAGGAGSWEMNLERWTGQFEQPDGRPSAEVAVHSQAQVAGRAMPQVEVSGRYVAAAMPGAPERYDEPGWKMLATWLPGADGAWYFKLVGPEATVDQQRVAWRKFLAAVEAR